MAKAPLHSTGATRGSTTDSRPADLVRDGLMPRERFLQTAAVTNAQMLNYSNVAGDARVPRQTVVQWYAVLRDTLVAFELPAWSRTVRRKAIETAKFYFFDTGVVRALRRLPPVSEASADFGEYFEHYVFLELRAWIDYRRPRTPLAYWRSRSGHEVDFILDERVAY